MVYANRIIATETILFTSLAPMQRTLYKQTLLRDIDVVNGTSGGGLGGGGKSSRTAVLNIVMQLRKVCNHPYLFEGVEDRSLDPLGEHLVEACGKLRLLDKLLAKLKSRGHRVLLFTQMTRLLDILEDFVLMREYEYCRIDGNTSYEDRQDLIDAYNAPDSSKFLFLLSTRAGGLGINLQTADTCILFDSDWNPQADLQAQDRAHRIGQKKPVSVYRLVTEDTIEEKVVERAQQKLKLDAMVVQQGRLADKDKMSKDDLLEALRFGADKVFRSKTTEITDEDIDAILESGRQRTAEMNEKLQQAEKGDLLDFKLDGGMATQQFDGIDYSTKEARDAVRDGGGGLLIDPTLAFLNMEDSKRERKAVSTYSENQRFALSDAPRAKKKPSKLPVHLRLPHRIEAWHLMKRERLYEISAQEESLYALTKPEDLPDDEREIAVLPEDLAREKNEIIANGFHSWSRLDYKNFIHGCNLHGRAASVEIAAHMAKNGSSKRVEEVAKYAHAYWETPLGEQSIPPAEWERNARNLEKGDRRREEVRNANSPLGRARARARPPLISRLRPPLQALKSQRATAEFVERFDHPWEDLAFNYASTKGSGADAATQDREFDAEEDRLIINCVHKFGAGDWEKIQHAVRVSERFRFDYFLQSCSADDLSRRYDTLIKMIEKDNAAYAAATAKTGEEAKGKGKAKADKEEKEIAPKPKAKPEGEPKQDIEELLKAHDSEIERNEVSRRRRAGGALRMLAARLTFLSLSLSSRGARPLCRASSRRARNCSRNWRTTTRKLSWRLSTRLKTRSGRCCSATTPRSPRRPRLRRSRRARRRARPSRRSARRTAPPMARL